MKPEIQDAISSLGYKSSYAMTNGVIESWDSSEPKTGEKQPTQADIDAELKKLQDEYDAQEYARKRQAEYPSIQELVVALYDTDDKSAIEAKRAEVKKKYPKPA